MTYPPSSGGSEGGGYQPFGGNFPNQGGTPMNYALWADRALAALLDGLLALAALVVIYIVVTVFTGIISSGAALTTPKGQDPGGLAGLLVCSGCCFWILAPPIAYFGVGLYNKVFLVAKRGSSIGQGVMKIRVVTTQGTLVPSGTLALRLLIQTGFGFVPLLPVLDLLWPLWDEKRQTLHDKAVGTFVVKEL